jgi:hypothetical protein
MLARLASLRLWLLAAMIVSAAAGLGGASLLYTNVERSHEHAADAAKALQEAKTIAAQVQAGVDATRLAALQDLLVNDRITIERGGSVVFQGPPRTGREFERYRRRFPAASCESPTTPHLVRASRSI